MKLVSMRYAVYAPDLPGFGKSLPLETEHVTVDYYTRIISQLVNDFVPGGRLYGLVADSLGAIIAIELIEKRQLSNCRLLLSGCPADGLPLFLQLGRIKGLVSTILKSIRRLPRFMSTYLIRFIALGTVNSLKHVDSIIVRDALRADPVTAELILKELSRTRIEQINSTDAELIVAVVRGSKDLVVSRDTSLRLSRMLKAPYYEILNARHTPMLEKANDYAKILSDLLDDKQRRS